MFSFYVVDVCHQSGCILGVNYMVAAHLRRFHVVQGTMSKMCNFGRRPWNKRAGGKMGF